MWGWSARVRFQKLHHAVFPHVCGDGPTWKEIIADRAEFSPRMWGWSVAFVEVCHEVSVFPTYVGMVRTRARLSSAPARFPHVCGDGPLMQRHLAHFTLFSPRMWGWSVVGSVRMPSGVVFPTYVGMVR